MTLGGPLPDRTLEGETLLAGLRRRWKGLGLLWLVLMGVILLRLWTLTVFYGEEYRRQAENNRTRVVTLKPPRGILYDRNGTPLVSNLPSFDISIVPEDVGQEKDVVARLASILGLDPDDVEERIADLKLRRPYEPVKIKENADWWDVTRDRGPPHRSPGRRRRGREQAAVSLRRPRRPPGRLHRKGHARTAQGGTLQGVSP